MATNYQKYGKCLPDQVENLKKSQNTSNVENCDQIKCKIWNGNKLKKI
jgi:hypothetical protein